MSLEWLKVTIGLVISLVICIGVFAEEKALSLEEIADIEERGRQIADYERAAIKTTDIFLAGNPDLSKVDVYLAINKDNKWIVYFGKLLDEKNEFKVAETIIYPDCLNSELIELESIEPVKDIEVSTEIFQLAKAIKLALRSISEDAQFTKYNINVFREKDGSITVYITPGNENPDVVLLGGDFKISVSSDGSEVLNKIKLHNSVLKMSLLSEGGKELVAAYHTHVLNDLPAETDIAIILLNPQLAPHFVTGPKWMSQIDADGKISILGKTEEALKTK